MVRGDVNPLLRCLGELDVANIAISTPDVEDLFLPLLRGNRRRVGGAGPAARASWTQVAGEAVR